jgi:UDP-N-acetylmuramoyl-tripeptide--D-alanyl-D-alanine ligase
LIAALLSPRLSIHKSPGNLNNAFGLPLALLALEPRHEVAVVELAMSAPGEIRRLTQIAAPEIGVVTNVAPVHLEFFDSVDSIARAKRELIENLAAPATAVLNYDDTRVRRFADGFAGRVVTFGFEPGAAVRGTTLGLTPRGGCRFQVTGAGLDSEFELRLPGRHNVENALAALATASVFQVPVEALRQALAAFQNLHQRSEILTLPGGITLLNDSYNSSPLAMERMLETLAAWPGARRRIVVAGEMLELGPESAALHREVGRKAVKCGADWLLGVQGDARFFLEGAAEAGLQRERMRFFATAREAGEYCRALVEAGDAVLVKGSRGVRLETVIGLLGGRFGRLPDPPADAVRKS